VVLVVVRTVGEREKKKNNFDIESSFRREGDLERDTDTQRERERERESWEENINMDSTHFHKRGTKHTFGNLSNPQFSFSKTSKVVPQNMSTTTFTQRMRSMFQARLSTTASGTPPPSTTTTHTHTST
jgi:hypothetical protein